MGGERTNNCKLQKIGKENHMYMGQFVTPFQSARLVIIAKLADARNETGFRKKEEAGIMLATTT